MTLVLLAALSLVAGAVTSTAGMGGGLMLVLGVSLLWDDPAAALAATTPALWVGNLHRLWLFQGATPWRFALIFAVFAAVGTLVGASVALEMDPIVLRVAMGLAAGFAVVRRVWFSHVEARGHAIVWPMAFGAGVASTAGGSTVFVGPVVLAAGIKNDAYIATTAIVAFATHVARYVALEAAGEMTRQAWLAALLIAVVLPFGNALGKGIRVRLSEPTLDRIELGTCVALVLLALLP